MSRPRASPTARHPRQLRRASLAVGSPTNRKVASWSVEPCARFNEVLRFESPVYVFALTATRDVAFGQVTVPEGSRVAVLYGSANRGERRWSHAESGVGFTAAPGRGSPVWRLRRCWLHWFGKWNASRSASRCGR